MSIYNMSKQLFLNKFGIASLNDMQCETIKSIESNLDVVLLSPTGTGKTLAFLLPLVGMLDLDSPEIQMLILVPTRELAQQIEQVCRKMGSGFKVNAVYGGRPGFMDKIDLKHLPSILIGTPGRIADRFRRDNFSLSHVKTLVLDEYYKSLEIGFEKEMEEIIGTLPHIQQRILTSATSDNKLPKFVGLHKPVFINYLKENNTKLSLKILSSPEKDKLNSLKKILISIGEKPGIIFFNFKDALQRVSDFLMEHDLAHECFHGDMEQKDREVTLIKFRNRSSQILLATDLAARGLDVPDIHFILHYHLPLIAKEFTHRNGRTARMNSDGVAYVLKWKGERLPDFVKVSNSDYIDIESLQKEISYSCKWQTLHISGGRRDKISKADVAGLFLKQGKIDKSQLGIIEIQQTSAYVAVHQDVIKDLLPKVNNSKLKKKKVRICCI